MKHLRAVSAVGAAMFLLFMLSIGRRRGRGRAATRSAVPVPRGRSGRLRPRRHPVAGGDRFRRKPSIDAIEARTGAEVVVYTQDSGTFPTTDETRDKALALMDQWGVGRKGFNDGLVIFFDMQPNLQHGQVQLYAGPGFEAAFLTNEERQAIFQNDMLPHLAAGDFDARPRRRAPEDRCRSDRRARRLAPALAPDQRGRRAGRRLRSCSWA